MDEKIPPYTIPQDVLLRYGGISNTQKEFLYAELQSLNFVYIPNFLKPQISGVHSLYRYGVCKSLRVINGESYGYFVCPLSLNPESHSFDAELKFCCGTPPQQYCCSSSQFSSGIHIVRSDLLISPSIVIGVSIGFLLLAIFFMIYAYSRLAHGLREKSTKLFYETSCVKCSNGSHISPQPLQSLELPLLSDMQPNEPPKKYYFQVVGWQKYPLKGRSMMIYLEIKIVYYYHPMVIKIISLEMDKSQSHTVKQRGSNLENAVRSCVQSEGCLGYLEVRRTAAYNIVGSGKAGLPKQMAAHTTLQTLKN
ncbi:unnamed protein product [Heterobilharzia americana]|nr:unnamed protein product [Heterobilharzia americana]